LPASVENPATESIFWVLGSIQIELAGLPARGQHAMQRWRRNIRIVEGRLPPSPPGSARMVGFGDVGLRQCGWVAARAGEDDRDVNAPGLHEVFIRPTEGSQG